MQKKLSVYVEHMISHTDSVEVNVRIQTGAKGFTIEEAETVLNAALTHLKAAKWLEETKNLGSALLYKTMHFPPK